MLGEIGRHAVGLFHVRIDLSVGLLGALDLPLHLADGGEILVELAAVGGTEGGFELAGVLADKIENTAAIVRLPRLSLRAENHAIAKEALKQRPRIENGRQRLGFALPRQVIGVGAGVAGIAVAGLPRVFHAHFERREPRLVGHVSGYNLVAGNAGPDIHGGFLDLNAGEVRPGAAAMIARAIEQRAPGVVGEVAQHEDIVAVRLHGLQDARQLAQPALVGGVPLVHDDAVGHIGECHAERRPGGAREGHRRNHGVQERKTYRRAHAAQKGSSMKRLPRDIHFEASSVFAGTCVWMSSPRRIWNGALRTIS